MPNFALAQTVSDNIRALRVALGSAVRPLSLQDLADMISARHPEKRALNASTVRRWESGEGEPDLQSLRVMAALAGVGFEQFALGGGTIHMESHGPLPQTAMRTAVLAQPSGKKKRRS